MTDQAPSNTLSPRIRSAEEQIKSLRYTDLRKHAKGAGMSIPQYKLCLKVLIDAGMCSFTRDGEFIPDAYRKHLAEGGAS